MHLVWFTPPCEILISIYRNWSDQISRRRQDQAQTSACEVVFYNFNVPLEQVWLFDQLWITNVVMSVAIKLMNQIFVDRRGQKCDFIVYSLKEQLFFYALPVNSSTNNYALVTNEFYYLNQSTSPNSFQSGMRSKTQ